MNSRFGEKLRKFFDKYDIKVLADSKKLPICRPMPNFFTDPIEKNLVRDFVPQYEVERIITVDIPESKLNRLSDIESTFFNNIEDVSARNLFDVWMNQQAEERRLRQEYEAVAEAYKQYSLMLNLARTSPEKLKFPD